MTAHTDSDAMVAFNDQEAVDRAFDDYVDREWVARRAPDESRARCRGCGGGNYCFGTSASGDIGAKICTDCGAVEDRAVIFERMFDRQLPTRSSNYKRIHHWHERVSQLLLLESPIPGDHMLAIGEKLLDGSHTVINKDTIRAALRSLGLQVYIEKWLQIIQRTTGVVPPSPPPGAAPAASPESNSLGEPWCRRDGDSASDGHASEAPAGLQQLMSEFVHAACCPQPLLTNPDPSRPFCLSVFVSTGVVVAAQPYQR